MKDTIIERATTAIATGGIAAPIWLPPLKEASEIAGLLLPIFGVVWLIVQIVTRLMRPPRS